MRFSLSEKRLENSFKDIKVTFPDGYTDTIILKKHYFNEEHKRNSGARGFIQLIIYER